MNAEITSMCNKFVADFVMQEFESAKGRARLQNCVLAKFGNRRNGACLEDTLIIKISEPIVVKDFFGFFELDPLFELFDLALTR